MKTPLQIKHRGRRSHLTLARAIALGIAVSGWPAQISAETVDSEILLLVDITRPGLSSFEFSRLMDGYATAFSSTQIMDSIQSGAYGRIAVSMMFFGNASTQVTGIPWMEIGNTTQAQQFANLARNVSRPFSVANPDVGSALTAATFSFGTETGGTSNGFESVVQIVEVASGREPQFWAAGSAATSSANALASGVDVINALALGNRANAVDNFYTANVIGSTLNGVPATSTTSQFNGALASTISGLMTDSVQAGAAVSATAVPEPSTLFGLIPATLLLLRRRKR